jgi:hypothetical protein
MTRASRKRSNPKPEPVPPDPRASHTAAISLDNRRYLLRFWTNAEWRALPAGEWADLRTFTLTGFGKLSIDPLPSSVDYANALCLGHSHPLAYPEMPELHAICGKHGYNRVLKLLQAALEAGGLSRAQRLIEEARARDAEDEAGFALADELRDQAEERAQGRPAYTFTEMDVIHGHAPARLTLDQAIEEELAEVREQPPHDRCIWRGSELQAVIRWRGDEAAEIIRFDRPENLRKPPR